MASQLYPPRYSPAGSNTAIPNMFRFGESPLWASIRFSGKPVKGVVFPFARDRQSIEKEIYAVSWEIYAQEKSDLVELMWNGELNWDFLQTRIPIGPCSMFHGSFFDMFFSQGAPSDLEQLAAVKAENEWRELCQTFLIGKTYFFRGLARYEKHPIIIPANADWNVRLDFPNEEFAPLGEVRMRVILNGRWKTPVDIP